MYDVKTGRLLRPTDVILTWRPVHAKSDLHVVIRTDTALFQVHSTFRTVRSGCNGKLYHYKRCHLNWRRWAKVLIARQRPYVIRLGSICLVIALQVIGFVKISALVLVRT